MKAENWFQLRIVGFHRPRDQEWSRGFVFGPTLSRPPRAILRKRSAKLGSLRAIRDQNQLACYWHRVARYTSTVSNSDEIIAKALRLPEEKRTQVALRLLDSLDAPDPHAHLTDDELQAELARRVKAVVDGTAELIPGDQAIEQLRAELKK